MHLIHVQGDLRCTNSSFECPSCGDLFQTSTQIAKHMEEIHTQETSLSLSSGTDTSSWMYVKCLVCDMKFQNEMDMNHHLLRRHEYGETCEIYPCDECGFIGEDLTSLKHHVTNEHDVASETVKR